MVTGEGRLAGMGTEVTAIGDLREQVAAAAAQADNPADLLETATKRPPTNARHRRPRAGPLGTPGRPHRRLTAMNGKTGDAVTCLLFSAEPAVRLLVRRDLLS